jgi:hypothetical protein
MHEEGRGNDNTRGSREGNEAVKGGRTHGWEGGGERDREPSLVVAPTPRTPRKS